jgi:hypothetical protein
MSIWTLSFIIRQYFKELQVLVISIRGKIINWTIFLSRLLPFFTEIFNILENICKKEM